MKNQQQQPQQQETIAAAVDAVERESPSRQVVDYPQVTAAAELLQQQLDAVEHSQQQQQQQQQPVFVVEQPCINPKPKPVVIQQQTTNNKSPVVRPFSSRSSLYSFRTWHLMEKGYSVDEEKKEPKPVVALSQTSVTINPTDSTVVKKPSSTTAATATAATATQATRRNVPALEIDTSLASLEAGEKELEMEFAAAMKEFLDLTTSEKPIDDDSNRNDDAYSMPCLVDNSSTGELGDDDDEEEEETYDHHHPVFENFHHDDDGKDEESITDIFCPSDDSSSQHQPEREEYTSTLPQSPLEYVIQNKVKGGRFKLIMLLSSMSGRPSVKAAQERAMTILMGMSMRSVEDEIEFLDGALAENRDRRNDLFDLSGTRSYPQFFLSDDVGNVEFLGDYDWMETMNDSGSLGASMRLCRFETLY
jgi:hypothetical protein